MSTEEKKEITMADICGGCSADKFVDGKCTAYPPAGQERWFKAGWCPLGSVGTQPPADWKPSKKKRIGQQKQTHKI